MTLTTWLLFIAVAAISILSPGPAVLVALRNGMSGGLGQVALSSLGNILGLACVAGLAVMGLGALLTASEWMFTLVKGLGALYLIYLGIRQWRSSSRATMTEHVASPRRRKRAVILEGSLVAISNPKAILFFTALFPQFLSPSAPLMPQLLLMVGTFMVMSFLALLTYGGLARTIAHWLRSPHRARWFHRAVGAAFIGLGASLLKLRQPV